MDTQNLSIVPIHVFGWLNHGLSLQLIGTTHYSAFQTLTSYFSRTKAQDIQRFISTLTKIDGYTWQSALLSLLQTFHLTMSKLEPLEAIETYLGKATGFLNANSFSGCHPPRTIRICTTSVLENAKCLWMRESAAVYGIEPDLDCVKADNTTHCMQALNNSVADIVMVPPDLVHTALKKYGLKTLFYETVNPLDKYLTVAVVKNGTGFNSIRDTRGTKACFPVYEGVAWNSVWYELNQRKLVGCGLNDLGEFFAESCAPGVPLDSLKELCGAGDMYKGEFGALKCLLHGKGDVAFVSKNTIDAFLAGTLWYLMFSLFMYFFFRS